MAEPLSIFDDPDGEAEARAVAQGRADIKAGRFVPAEDVLRWIESWGTENELPKPQCK